MPVLFTGLQVKGREGVNKNNLFFLKIFSSSIRIFLNKENNILGYIEGLHVWFKFIMICHSHIVGSCTKQHPPSLLLIVPCSSDMMIAVARLSNIHD
jgi:hypothetical protein